MNDTNLTPNQEKPYISDNIENSQFIYNSKDRKVLSTIIDNLNNCEQFIISVAFITDSGVSLLIPTLLKLESKGIKGKVLSGTYLNFTDPSALRKLNTFSNLEVKLVKFDNFHAKGYFFKQDEVWTSLIGSSNLTQSALTISEEWNVLNKHSLDSKLLKDGLDRFNTLWNEANILEDIIDSYELIYKEAINDKAVKPLLENKRIVANSMQEEALKSLEDIRKAGADKALVVSATGSGKTILAALDVKQVSPKRMLFVVHRENIAIKAATTFERVIGSDKSYGMYAAANKQIEADYVFATIQSINNNLDQIVKQNFDYIIIDEVHHGGAKSYQNLFKQTKPAFWLGLTATPERSDGFNIFEMFDYNLAYEYRLKSALEDQLLCPFHYFGVKDITVDNQTVTESATIDQLTAKARVDHIVNTIHTYTTIETISGLIFVSNKSEAWLLSEKLNERGMRTTALTSSDSEQVREEAITKLENNKLDYIITVDIFNEGIDIPCVNQVLLLRPTKSAIVYIQQIGRGLRRYPDKEFVTIIDFIGNYKNNYLIPIALSSDDTYNKDRLKKEVILNGVTALTGASTIQFEEVLQEELINSITNTNFSTLSNIKHDYNYLQSKLDRVPTLLDFYDNKLISPEQIVNNDIYPLVKAKITKEELNLTKEQQLYIEYVSKLIYPAGRLHEIFILQEYINNPKANCTVEVLTELFEGKYNTHNQYSVMANAIAHLSKHIFKSISDEYKFSPYLTLSNNIVSIDSNFAKELQNTTFKCELEDILGVAEKQYLQSNYDIDSLLTRNQSYTRKQAYKYLLKDFNNGYQVGGYTVFGDIAIMFITLDDSNSYAQYDNELLSQNQITWFSKANRKLIDKQGNLTTEGILAENKVAIKLFVKRNSSEKFYYLGDAITQETIQEPNRIKYIFKLQEDIDKATYDYLRVKVE